MENKDFIIILQKFQNYTIMRKFAILLLAVFSLTIVSCKQSVPDQLLKIAKEAEAKGDKWSQEKWAETINQFGELLDKFEASDESDNTFKAIKVFGATYRFSEQATKYVVAPELKAKLKGLADDDESEESEEGKFSGRFNTSKPKDLSQN